MVGKKRPPRTPEEREARKKELKDARIAKVAKKENQSLKKLQKATKKAKDFEVRKLKRRLRLINLAIESEAAGGTVAKPGAGVQAEAKAGEAEPVKAEPKSDSSTEESSSSEEEEEEAVPSGRQTQRVYENETKGGAAAAPQTAPKPFPKHEKSTKEKVSKQLQSGLQLCHLAVANMAGQELGMGITKEVEIKLRSDHPPAAATEPVSEELLAAMAERVLKHKGVREEVEEAKVLVAKLKADDEKAERRAAKSARKAANKAAAMAAAEAAKAERAALGLSEEPENEAGASGEGVEGMELPAPPPGSKKQRRQLKVKERREQKKQQKVEKRNRMGQRARARAALQVKDKSKYAIKNPEAHAIKKAARLKKRKAAREAKEAAAKEGGPSPAKKAKRGPPPPGQAGKAKASATEPLHPSWAAKKQQPVAIGTPSGKKVMFGD